MGTVQSRRDIQIQPENQEVLAAKQQLQARGLNGSGGSAGSAGFGDTSDGGVGGGRPLVLIAEQDDEQDEDEDDLVATSRSQQARTSASGLSGGQVTAPMPPDAQPPSQVGQMESMGLRIPAPAASIAEVEPFAVAFSGGGIRAAAISSGVLCYLNSRGLLSAITDLSSVSGGGYTSTSYVLWRQRWVAAQPREAVELMAKRLPEPWLDDYFVHLSQNAGYCCNWAAGFCRGLVDTLRFLWVLLCALSSFAVTYAPLSVLLSFSITQIFGHWIVHDWSWAMGISGILIISVPIAVVVVHNAVTAQCVGHPHIIRLIIHLGRGLTFITWPVAIVVLLASIPVSIDTLGILVICLFMMLIGQSLTRAAGRQWAPLVEAGISHVSLNVLQAQLVRYMCGGPVDIGGLHGVMEPYVARLMVLVSGIVLGGTYFHLSAMRGRLWGEHNQGRLKQAFYPKDEKGELIDPPIEQLRPHEESGIIPKVHVGMTARNWIRATVVKRTEGEWDWDPQGCEHPVIATSECLTRIDSSCRTWPDVVSRAPTAMRPPRPVVMRYTPQAPGMSVSECMATSAAAIDAEEASERSSITSLGFMAIGLSMSWWRKVIHKPRFKHIEFLFFALLFSCIAVPSILVYVLEKDWLVHIATGSWVSMMLLCTIAPDQIGGFVLGTLGPVMNLRVVLDLATWKKSSFPQVMLMSDGGHSENLGLIAMLKQRRKRILCLDMGHEPNRTCDALLNAIKLAKLYLDCHVLPPADAPERDVFEYIERVTAGAGGADVTEFRIQYAKLPGQAAYEEGLLVLVKTDLCSWTDIPEGEAYEQTLGTDHIKELHNSAKHMPIERVAGCCCNCCHANKVGQLCSRFVGKFPNTTTANQFFTPVMFNAYHRLGFLVAFKAGALLGIPAPDAASSSV